MKKLFLISIVLATTTAFASVGQIEMISLNQIQGIITNNGYFASRAELLESIKLNRPGIIEESLTIVTNTQKELEAESIVLVDNEEALIFYTRGVGDLGGG